MKQCKFCGHWGVRMTEARDRFSGRPNGWKCYHPIACIKRQDRAGKWFGKRVLRRVDIDGTTWRIDPDPLRRNNNQAVVMTLTYRDHRLVSHHPDVDAAKSHADEMVRAWTANSLRQYASGR